MMNRNVVVKWLFIAYIMAVLVITQLPLRYPFPLDPELLAAILDGRIFQSIQHNLIPFSQLNMLIETLHYSSGFDQSVMLVINYFRGFVLNIILFIPLGILLPIFKQQYRAVAKVLIFSLALSIGIELLQLVQQMFGMTFWRIVDVEDVLANVIGALLGFLFYSAYRKKRYEAEDKVDLNWTEVFRA